MTAQEKPKWDLARFVDTLTYFDALPLSDQARQFQQWLQGQSQGIALGLEGTPTRDTLLIAGAVQPITQAILLRLLATGEKVRLLVPDLAAARAQLGEAIDLVSTENLSHAIPGIKSILCLPGLAPDVIQDLIQQITPSWQTLPDQLIFDFRKPTSALKDVWGALDDVVMGGVSNSQIQIRVNTAAFVGTVSTEKSGGFASLRTRNFDPALDLSQYDGIQLRVKGDGKRYKFFLRTKLTWDSLAYFSGFDTEPDTWITIRVPFEGMIPVVRARTQKNAPPFDPSQIRSMQLMLSKFEVDKALNPKFEAGPFALELHSIGAYRSPVLPQVVLINPGKALDPIETMLKDSELRSTIIRSAELTDGAGGQSIQFGLGDDQEGGSISVVDMAEIGVQSLKRSEATNTIFAVQPLASDADTPATWDQRFASLQKS